MALDKGTGSKLRRAARKVEADRRRKKPVGADIEAVRSQSAGADRAKAELAKHGFVGASERSRTDELAAAARRRSARGENVAYKPGVKGIKDATPAMALKVPLLQEAGREAGMIVRGLPKAAYGISKALATDVATAPASIAQGEFAFEHTARATVDPIAADLERRYGPLLPGGRPASETLEEIKQAPLSTALDFLAVGNVLAGGARAGKIAATTSGGPVTRYRATKALPPVREMRSRGAVVQFPTSSATLTRGMQRGLDRVSERLEDVPVVGARTRVAKQKSREIRNDMRRAQALAAEDVAAIHDVGGRPATFGKVRDRAARTGMFWEAAMPASLRGGQGLKMVADDLRNEAKGHLAKAKELAERQQKSATPGPRGREARDLGPRLADELRHHVRTAKRLEIQAAKAERAIGKKYDPEAVGAAERLMDERARIFKDAGKLSDEAEESGRTWLARRLGVEDAEGAVFVGHRTRGRSIGERFGRPGLGKTKTPPGIGQERTGAAYTTGRVITDPDEIVKDYQRAQVYDFHNRTKDFFGDIGDPIVERPNPGWYVVNPQGHRTPREWKDADPREIAAREGYSPDEALYRDADEYVRNYIAEAGTPEAKRLMAAAPNDVVQVPPQVVSQFFNRLTGRAGVAFGPGRKIAEGADIANDLMRLSLIYANPGYIPANLGGNLAFAVAQQGPFYLAPNLIRGAKVMHGRNPRFKNLLFAEVSMGPTKAIVSEGKNVASRATRRVAAVVSRIPDDDVRAAAWMHEARKAGYRTAKTQERLLEAAARGDKRARQVANEIRDRVNVAMVDFERLGPLERAVAHRILFVWPWIRGASRYPFRFAADKPVRSAAAAHASLEAERDPELRLKGRPDWLAQAFPTGPVEGGLQRIVNPRSASIVSTPLEVGQTLAGAVTGQGEEALVDLASPMVRFGIAGVTGRNRFGQDVGGPRAVWENLRTMSPLVNTALELEDPSRSARIYGPQDRAEVLRRRLGRGVVPMQISRGAAAEQADDLSKPERAYRKTFETRQAFAAAASEHMADSLEDGKLPEPLRQAFNRNAERWGTYARLGIVRGDPDYQQKALAADVRLFVKWGLASEKDAREAVRWARTASKEEIEKVRGRWSTDRDGPFQRAYLAPILYARKALEQAGAKDLPALP